MTYLKAKTAAAALCAILAAGAVARETQRPGEIPQRARDLLSQDSFWRFHVTLRKPIVPAGAEATGSGAAEAVVLPVKVMYRSYPGLVRMETAPPPAGWTGCDFDDADWPRARAGAKWRGSVAEVAFGPGVRFSTALLCLRGKFSVAARDPGSEGEATTPWRSPAAVEGLYLSMKYRGGVVVYLNGREIARQHLPAGRLDSAAPATPYPPEAYLDATGKPIPGAYHAGKRIRAGEKDLADRIARRDRTLGPLRVPGQALRKGVNVLAVELHRSDYHPSARLWFRDPHFRTRPAWVPVGLLEVRLAAAGLRHGAAATPAEPGGGAVPNVARPRGFQVWNQDVNDRVNVLDYGDPNEPLRPIRLIGTRNGAFSGQVVVGSGRPIRGLDASATSLKGPDGKAVIPAGKIRIRFGVLDGRGYQRPDWFDGLTRTAPAEVPVHKTGAAVLPVWVTVHVPRDAAPGVYRGMLTIQAEGAERVRVPIHLHVADWALPDPKDFRTYVGLYQSPTSLALQYGVGEWSEAHWALMDKSFELLGRIGNRMVIVPLSNRTQFGNDEGMVYWRKKPDGTFEHDFSVFDRYLRLVRKHLGRPDFVAVQVWHSGGWQSRGPKQRNTVTVIDPKTHRRERMQVPPFGTPESKRFWKPVLDAIRRRLADAGLAEAMCLGILSDGTAPPEVFRAFDEIVPGVAKWTRGCHSVTRKDGPYPLKGGGVVVCHEFCYGMAMADPADGLPPIWKQRRRPGVAYIRHNFDDTLSLLKYRTMAERSLFCGTRGIGRIGLDFWNVIQDARGRMGNIYNRWPHSSCAQRSPNLYRLAAPGPNGPIPTARFEQFRQGIQDAEAAIFVAEAAGRHAEKLGPELADECRRVIIDRLRYCSRRCPEGYGHVYFRSYHHGWRELTRRLYTAAAKAARKLR